MKELILKSGYENMNISLIHRFLSEDSYWAKGIPIEVVANSLSHSFCVGAFIDDEQVGFARLITDFSTFGWLADVFVLPAYRGKGISKQMMEFITNQAWSKQLRKTMLGTRDAHELYRQFGFQNLAKPENTMEIHRPDIYRK